MDKAHNGIAIRHVSVAIGLFLISQSFVAAKINKGEDDDNLTQEYTAVAKKDADLKNQIAATTPDSPEKQQLLDQQAQLRKQGDQILASCPTCPGLLTKGSDAALTRGDMKEAQGLADQAVNAADSMAAPSPAKLVGALDQRGLVGMKTGDYQKAMDDAQRALVVSPTDQQALSIYRDAKAQIAEKFAAGKAANAAKKMAAAMQESAPLPDGFHSAVGDDSRFKATARNLAAAGHMNEAKRLLDLGDAEGALRSAQAAEAASPAFAADADVMRAQAWSVLKDLSKALAQITEAIDLLARQGRKGDLAAAYSQRASFQNDLKNSDAAAADAGMALATDPKLASAYFERARADEALGNADVALADIDQAAALDAGFMADRDEFHKRHRRTTQAGEEEAVPPHSWTASLRSGWFLNLGVVLAGLTLLALGGRAVWTARRGSPVGRITWPRIAGGADRDDGPRELDGQYRIVKKIGEGGMGTVYEGYDKNLKRKVAIKRLRPELQKNPRERARFIQEAELVAALQHPHAVQIYTIIRDDEDTHIVFEYIAGGTLSDLLNASPGRRLQTRRALELLRQIAEAVDHAHGRRVIHRDLKPANVMIDERGEAKVMDFGIARQVRDSLAQTAANTVVGTPAYMAPEQSRGEARKESDVYALGVTFHEMLTGGLSLDGPAPSLLLPGLPPAIDAVLAKAVAPRPEDRYRSCADFYRAAESALGQSTPI